MYMYMAVIQRGLGNKNLTININTVTPGFKCDCPGEGSPGLSESHHQNQVGVFFVSRMLYKVWFMKTDWSILP